MFVDQEQVTAPAIVDPERRIALAAADRLEKYGWIQMAGQSIHGSCIQAAIARVSVEEPGGDIAGVRLQAKLAEHVGAVQLWVWNDTPGRTKAEVVGLLRAYGNGEIK